MKTSNTINIVQMVVTGISVGYILGVKPYSMRVSWRTVASRYDYRIFLV